MAKLISKTYGEALVELAVEENKVDDFVKELTVISQILKENSDFDALMNHPKIVKEEKKKVMENVFRGRISDELLGFFLLIIEKDRYGEIDSILSYFIDQVKAIKGIGIVYVTTAVPLGQQQKQKIEQRLLQTTGYKEVEMHYDVDEALIGGMKIRIGDRVVDSSVQTKLSELTKQLMRLQLA
ncbi:MAG: F0F1 ATP synthase subunit delta [Lachnospiraceae bacterium]|nr:F0F1 ATP synthase subunit delta [Lachnospiraceae bacterium]